MGRGPRVRRAGRREDRGPLKPPRPRRAGSRARSRAFVALLVGVVLHQGVSAAAAPAQEPPEPPVLQGRIAPAREAEAAQIFAAARDAFDAGQHAEARRLAASVVDEYPTAPVSGRALMLYARASLEAGFFEEADEAAERYVRLLAADDPRQGEVRLLQATAMEGVDDLAASLERLLRILARPPADVAGRAIDAARRAADRLDPMQLDDLASRVPAGALVAPVVLARQARELQRDGFQERADAFARAALSGGATGTDARIATAVLEGRRPRPGFGGPTVRVGIATVLPTTGAPGLSDFAALIAEGVQVAAASMRPEGFEVEITSVDDGGDLERTRQSIRDLERERIIGAVGFLEDQALMEAGRSRTRDLVLVSPTARTAESAGEGVYSLEGPDPRAAIAIAEHAQQEAYQRVAIVHSRAPASVAEADAFQARVEAAGIPVVARLAYEIGSTYFGQQIQTAVNALRAEEIAALGLGEEDTLHVELLEPVAVFLPVPFEDLELLAPQVTHFGLDTLAIDVLGTSGWTNPRVLQTVDQRHTNGVVATAAITGGPGTPGYIRFEEAYEDHFQRSLVSPIPALGYDAALLLLQAARAEARSPTQVRRAIEDVRDLDGATGRFSVLGGRVIRETEVVQIEHGMLLPIGGFIFGGR